MNNPKFKKGDWYIMNNPKFKKGDLVEFRSANRGSLTWVRAIVLGYRNVYSCYLLSSDGISYSVEARCLRKIA